MTTKDLTAHLTPFVRIALWALGGYLSGLGADNWLVTFIRTDPGILASTAFGLAAGWYAIAKWRGWKT